MVQTVSSAEASWNKLLSGNTGMVKLGKGKSFLLQLTKYTEEEKEINCPLTNLAKYISWKREGGSGHYSGQNSRRGGVGREAEVLPGWRMLSC